MDGRTGAAAPDLASLASLCRDLDWGRTALGPRDAWSDTLRSAVALTLNTRFPVTLFWGPEFTMVYNDGYAELIGDKHPAALGANAADVFPEIWDVIGPMLRGVQQTDDPFWVEDARLLLYRHGFAEETFFTFCYSAVPNTAGATEGVIDIATETTKQVVDRRRMVLLSRLGAELGGLREVAAVCEATATLAAGDEQDVVGVEIRHPDLAAVRRGRALPEPPGAVPSDLVVQRVGDDVVAWSRVTVADPRAPTGEQPSGDAVLIGIVLSPNLDPDGAYLDFLRLINGALGQALSRIAAADADARIAAAERELSMTMQQSLLSRPAESGRLEVAVRYQPAMEQARIGGDWYDSFLLPDGSLVLAVGDVSGHDRTAAAAMAQVRNLLRGIAFTRFGPPSRILDVLNSAMRGLGVGVFATAVVAQVEQDNAPDADGQYVLRWSNAGHPPPVLLDGDGARLLEAGSELMLGPRPSGSRTDHAVPLPVGSVVLLYTDGLVERRDAPIDQGLSDLLAALQGQAGRTSEELCSYLLDTFAGSDRGHDDDVVLLALRVRPDEAAASIGTPGSPPRETS